MSNQTIRFPASTHTPPTIGVLVGSTEDSYGNTILRAVSEVALQAGAKLVCFTSGTLRSYHGFEAQRNVLYDLVAPSNVDGLVISGGLSHSVSFAELIEFCQRYQPLPIVSIAVAIPGFPSVTASSRGGMAAIMQHVLDYHSYRRIAFIGGPPGQQEAEERLATFKQWLAEREIPLEPAWVVHGDYTQGSGVTAMEQLLAQPNADFELVVLANDSMALGALEVLQAHNRPVPESVAVVGFDDMEESSYSTPPLTTVRQSAYLQARQAARLLVDSLAGAAVPLLVDMPPHLVVRQSCGCIEQPLRPEASMLSASYQTPTSDLAARRESLLAAMLRPASMLPEELARGWVAQLLDAFIEEIAAYQPLGVFIAALSSVLEQSAVADSGRVWHGVLSALRAQAIPILDDFQLLLQAENLWQQARTLIGETTHRRQVQLRFQAEQQAVVLREVSEALIRTYDLTNLLDVITWELPRLGITACYLSLFEDPKAPAEWARLILAYDAAGRQALPPEGLRFRSLSLVPEEARPPSPQPSLMVVEALHSKEERLGFVLFEVDAARSSVCGAVRGQLGSALQSVMLMEQRRQAELQLREYQNQLEHLVEARTQALTAANAQLQQEIVERQRTEQEREQLIVELERKNAELERFTYTVSHDLKSPLITIRGFLGFLEKDTQAGDQARMQSDIKRISDATDKMQRLLNELLELSRIGRMMNPPQEIAFETIAREAVELVSGRLTERGVQVEIAPDLPSVYGDRARLLEVVQNLIDNAVKFMGGQPQPRIEIGLQRYEPDGKPVFFIRDNGIGIDPRYHEKIFGLFDKLDPHSEGTGVGLALVKRIVDVHGGKIWVESAGPGQGTTFYLSLPCRA
jgi:DNA-binding LacI/PurR family transcriptional regulator/signal transduction histidine kinase